MRVNNPNPKFWQNKRVFLTGHTGFKGAWLSLWLKELGADVIGLSLPPNTTPNLFTVANMANTMPSIFADVREDNSLSQAITQHQPDIVIHTAAQPLVAEGYRNPVETYSTNMMGTVNLLEACRNSPHVKSIIIVTSDKCYQNNFAGVAHRFQEQDRLGGDDPYSSSKACAELITATYRTAFFQPRQVGVATVRAGNVIGGGDWSAERLLPDIIRHHRDKSPLVLRYPQATRPWQHVLDALRGYLLLAEQLCHQPALYSEAWNFGPSDPTLKTVEWVARFVLHLLQEENNFHFSQASDRPFEATALELNCSKAYEKLQWQPYWDIERTLVETAQWYNAFYHGENMLQRTKEMIHHYGSH